MSTEAQPREIGYHLLSRVSHEHANARRVPISYEWHNSILFVSSSLTLPEFEADLANFLLTRGPYAWLGHGWLGCSHEWVLLSWLVFHSVRIPPWH